MRQMQCRASQHAYVGFPIDTTRNGSVDLALTTYRLLDFSKVSEIFYFSKESLEKQMTGQTSIPAH